MYSHRTRSSRHVTYKTLWLGFVLLGLALSTAWTSGAVPLRAPKDAAPKAVAPAPHHPERVLVRYRPGTTPERKGAVRGAARALATLKQFDVVSDLELLKVGRGRVADAVARFKRSPEVLYAEPDYEVHTLATPDDEFFSTLWGMHNTGQDILGDLGTAGADIRATIAWDLWTGDPDFRIAVIDTGVNYNHPDLAANIWTNPDEIPGNGIDDDGNGWVDDVHGYDFANSDGDPMDDHFHGSHVAGTIGAFGNNALGVVGVNWRCKIVGLKFLGAQGSGFTSDAVLSVQYVIANNIRVSNNSWGGIAFSQSLYDAIEASQAVGHVFVAAAGNDAEDNDVSPHYPAAYDLPNIITVAATDNDDQLATFSNWGLQSVDLGAPGVRIPSTVLGGDYAYASGTSMASPHVAGVVALLMSRSPQLTWSEVRDRILERVRPVESLVGITVTEGVVSAAAVLGDCNANGIDDDIDISVGTSEDCTGNGIPDECEPDCNANTVADSCDIASGTSTDCDGYGRPDECEPDCNGNGVADQCDIAGGLSGDCNFNHVPDECELGGTDDCNGNGTPDLCEVFDGTGADCNGNGALDACDLLDGTSEDCNTNGIPDECEIGLRIAVTGEVSQEFQISLTDDGHHITVFSPGNTQFVLDLSSYDVLLLGPAGFPSPDGSPGDWVVDAIDRFVEGGGGLIRIQDPPGFSSQYYGKASPVVDATGWVKRTNATVIDSGHPLAAGLASTSTLTGYSAVYTLKPDAEVILEWAEDGEPMTVAYRHGAGRVVFLNDLWASYPDFWGGDPSYGQALQRNVLAYVNHPADDCNRNSRPDDCDIDAGVSEDCTGNGIPDECEPDCNENSVPDSCDILVGTSEDRDSNGVPDECTRVIFVAAAATGDNDGTSWTNAFSDLEVALANAALIADSESDTQIWVADGVYVPSRRTDAADPRSATFELLNFVSVLGGFAGGDESIETRNPREFVTVLSGDVAGDDGPGFTNNDENAYHVVTANWTFPSAVLDGFTITAGHAYTGSQSDTRMRGAGLFFWAADATVRNCTIIGNRAFDAAGAYLLGQAPSLTNCTFLGNQSGRRGGAVQGSGTGATFINCVISGNSAGDDPVYNGAGGGMDFRGSGGAPVLTNCALVGNVTYGGPGNGEGGGISLIATDLTLSNCILWDNVDSGPLGFSAQLHVGTNATAALSHCNILGWNSGAGGIGNIAVNPLFVDADGPDGVTGTLDDNFRLTATSPCIDAGDNGAVPPDRDDLDRDGDTNEPLSLDLDGAARFYDDPFVTDTGSGMAPIVDMGPHEHGDCNGNDVPDVLDIGNGTSQDCNGNGRPDECESDCNGNGLADECDVSGGTSDDCDGNLVPDECEADSDNDGVINGCDGCPFDGNKLSPGVCGCGVPDEDDDGDTVMNCVDLCPGFDDRMDGDGDGVPDDCDQCEGHDDGMDCNGNSYPDACDILEGTSVDEDANNVPDECDLKPLVVAEGSRYLAVTPITDDDPVAIRVTSPAYPCVTMYAGTDGVLQPTPVYQLPGVWGSAHVRGSDLIPDATYQVRVELEDGTLSVPTEGITWPFGEVDQTPGTSFGDISAVVDVFRNVATEVSLEAADLHPCDPDGNVNFADISAAVDAFRAVTFADSCAKPCP